MRIYLDTRDLIGLLEREGTIPTAEDFSSVLLRGNHTLVLSFPLICEIAEPLWDPTSTTLITRTLTLLQNFPHEWIDIGHLPDLEVQAAIDSYAAGRPYSGVDPFVRGFIDTFENPPTEARMIINYELPAIVFDLRQSGSFDPRAQKRMHGATYRELFAQERNLLNSMGNKVVARRTLFVQRVLDRMGRLNALGVPDDMDSRRNIAEAIQQDPTWCPSTRLGFEAFHSLVDDIGDQLGDGDLGDFSNLKALPYVDLFTTDRRFAAHIERVDRILGLNYSSKIRRSASEVIQAL